MTLWAVTGGTGLVGRFIVEHLLAAGEQVAVLGRTRLPDPPFSRPVEVRPFLLGQPGVPGLAGVDRLVHCAFDHVPGRYRGGEGDDPEGFRSRNVAGSLELFAAARAAGVRAAVFLSSRAVYGAYPPGARLSETMEPRPDTLYGEAKLAVEEGLAALAGPDFAAAALRATGVFGAGPGQKWAGLLADHLAGRPVAPRVATEVHGADLAEAVRRVAGRSGVWNVSDLVLDRHDLLAAVNALAGRDLPLPPRADAAGVSEMDCSLLRGLGWRPGGAARLRADLPAMLAACGAGHVSAAGPGRA
ncbi:NAD-dependent epimerase/dehydratase family protein [Mangrovicoccus algicola]|uniref:NAD(P)-dependent oxidoreductase n=1 Tax=Mangrovicoccus algicola TaxID=2771008 RepID=A0A8J6YYM3_9RHOB|nr:NAD(P)-dependent oxidoreductase [Mangrovicoccus algicola]MBE3640045.1 NAD(P)-dependent oxidoreductase [Mangrovicoccus algicola]